MKYKSKNLDFLNGDMKISGLCYHGDHYYFESDDVIEGAEISPDAEYAEARASIVAAEPSLTAEEKQDARETYLMVMME